MTAYGLHLLIGLVAGSSGAVARGWCQHRWHQILVGVALIALESAVAVTVVG